MPDLLLMNGPNLRNLGTRQPEIYGRETLADVEAAVGKAVAGRGWTVLAFQSHAEHELIEFLEAHDDAAGAILNPGALMMAGWSLRDALAAFPAPWIEVHLSNVWAREAFRHESVVSPLAAGVIAGLGAHGYVLAAQALLHRVPEPPEN